MRKFVSQQTFKPELIDPLLAQGGSDQHDWELGSELRAPYLETVRAIGAALTHVQGDKEAYELGCWMGNFARALERFDEDPQAAGQMFREAIRTPIETGHPTGKLYEVLAKVREISPQDMPSLHNGNRLLTAFHTTEGLLETQAVKMVSLYATSGILDNLQALGVYTNGPHTARAEEQPDTGWHR